MKTARYIFRLLLIAAIVAPAAIAATRPAAEPLVTAPASGDLVLLDNLSTTTRSLSAFYWVPITTTVNGHQLNANITLTGSDLGLGSASLKSASGSGTVVASVTGAFTVGHIAVFSDTSGTIDDGGAPGSGSGTVTHTVGALTANQLLLGNGGSDAEPLGSLGTTTTVYHGNASGAGSFGSVVNADLATMGAHTYKGNNTGSTAAAGDISAANVLTDIGAMPNVMTTVGDTPYEGSGPTAARLPIGNQEQAYTVSSALIPHWSNERVAVVVAQTAHGFTAGEVLYQGTSAYTAAISSSTMAVAKAVGVVESSIDSNHFLLVTRGPCTLSGLTEGSEYFVGTSAGAITTTAPSSGFSCSIGVALSTTVLDVNPQEPGAAGVVTGTDGGTGVNNGSSTFTFGGNTAFSGAFTFTGTVTANTSVTFPTSGTLATNMTVNSQSTAYTLVLADANSLIYHPASDTTARTFTIPANSSVAYAVGDIESFFNDVGAGTVTIAITSDTLVLANAGTTGSVTLNAGHTASATKVTSTRWIINLN